MTIYKIAAHVQRKRFMESDLHFTEEMNVIADSLDQALAYVRQRFPDGGDQKVTYSSKGSQQIRVLFDCREQEERIIV